MKFIKKTFFCFLISGLLFVNSNTIADPEGVNSDITVAPSPAYFGQIPISSNGIRDISIFNISASSITISKFEIKGTDNSKFIMLNNPGSKTLGILENFVLQVKYVPTSKTEDSAILALTTNSGTTEINLNGLGVETNNGILMERIIGTVEPDGFGGITQVADNGYLLVGNTTLLDEQYSDFLVIKTDEYGSPVWQTSFGGNFADGGTEAQEINGSYYIVGNTSSFGNGESSIYLAKLNTEGTKEWERIYTGQFEDWTSSMIKTSDGNLLIAGGTNSVASSGRSALLLKVDKDGNEVWKKSIGGDKSAKAEQVIEISDGYVFVGTAENGAGNFDIYLAKVDFNGNVIWEKFFGGTESESGNGVSATSDGGFILCGYTVSYGIGARDAFLVKVSSSLSEEWHKEFGDVHNDAFNRVLELVDGGYIAVGSTVFYLDANNVYTNLFLVTTDANGNMVTEKEYGGDRSDSGSRIIFANDSQYAIGGNTNSFSKDGDFYFLKVNSGGEITSVEKNNINSGKLPKNFSLEQNYPNPFNGQTIIQFNIPKTGVVELSVFNTLGQKIKTLYSGSITAGRYTVHFNMDNTTSGNYIVALTYNNRIESRKIVHLK